MTKEQNIKCQAIIYSASAAAFYHNKHNLGNMAIPVLEVQVAMIIALGEVFNIQFNRSYAESLLKTKITEYTSKMLVWRLLKWLPFMGTFINNTCTVKITEFIGWEIANEFSEKLVFD